MKKYFLILLSLSILVGCSSLTPTQFIEKFPERTDSDFYEILEGNEAVSNGNCKLLVKNRKYVSPVGLTLGNDMNNGAKGIDEWVQADGGNGYILNNFEWVSVGDDGATQLILYFDTILCE